MISQAKRFVPRHMFYQRLHRALGAQGIFAKGGKTGWVLRYPDGSTRDGLDFEAMIEIAREIGALAADEDVPR